MLNQCRPFLESFHKRLAKVAALLWVSHMVPEEIRLDIEAEDLQVVLGVNSLGNIIASGPADDVKQLVANPAFIERFFGGVALKVVLDLIHDDSYEITGNRDRVAEARHTVNHARKS